MKITFKTILSNIEEIIAGSFLIITTSLVLINVFTRYFLKTGIYWTEEVATGCFVWSVFIGSAAAFKKKMHVGVDMLVKKLNQKVHYIVQIVVDILLILITSTIAYNAFVYLKISARKPTPVLAISSAYISSSILISFVLMTIYSIFFLYKDIKDKQINKGGSDK